MRNLIFLLVVLAIAIGIYGYYQSWFQVTEQKSDSKLDIGVTVDKNKVREDTEKAKEKLRDLKNQATEKTKDSSDKEKPPNDKP
jgi:hypothetical protein